MFYEFPRDFKRIEPAPGFLVRAVYGQSLMLCNVTLEAHSESPPHRHPYEEMGLIVEGEFEMTVGGKTGLLRKGDVFLAPPDTIHGGITHERRTSMISAFSPPREDYK